MDTSYRDRGKVGGGEGGLDVMNVCTCMGWRPSKPPPPQHVYTLRDLPVIVSVPNKHVHVSVCPYMYYLLDERHSMYSMGLEGM